jgi:Histidinol dehydrogenase
VLVAIDLPESVLSEVDSQVDTQARALERVDIVRQSVAKSIIVQVDDLDAALSFSNDYAPEHLILHITKAAEALTRVQNAGSVFVGPFSPERQVPAFWLLSGANYNRHPLALPLRFFAAVETTHREQTTRCPQMATHASSAALTRSPSRSTSLRKNSLPTASKYSAL